MKITKFSLISALAICETFAGSFGDAIKDVGLFGDASYEYRLNDNKYYKDNNTTKRSYGTHRFLINLGVNVKFSDEFFGVLDLRYDNYDISGKTDNENGLNAGYAAAGASMSGWGDDNDFDVRQVYLGYVPFENTTISGGRMVVGSFFTNDIIGTGAKVVNTSIDGLKVQVSGFDTLQNSSQVGINYFGTNNVGIGGVGLTIITPSYLYVTNSGIKPTQHNFYDAGVSFESEIITAGGYFSYLEDIASLYAFDLGGKLNINENLGFGLKGQYAGNKIDDWFKDDAYNDVDDAKFWALMANAKVFGLGFKTGFAKYSTKDGKYSFSSLENEASLINPLQKAGSNAEIDYDSDLGHHVILANSPLKDVLNYSLYSGDNKYWFVGADYDFGSISLGLTYIDSQNTNATNERGNTSWTATLNGIDNKTSSDTILTTLSYAYNKKLNFSAFHKYTNMSFGGSEFEALGYKKNKLQKYGITAKYSF